MVSFVLCILVVFDFIYEIGFACPQRLWVMGNADSFTLEQRIDPCRGFINSVKGHDCKYAPIAH